jgi:hypothetical protein
MACHRRLVKTHLARAQADFPESYQLPLWLILDREGKVICGGENVVQEGDLLLILTPNDPESRSLPRLVEVLHSRSGVLGYVERGLLAPVM